MAPLRPYTGFLHCRLDNFDETRFQFLRCSGWSPRLERPRITNSSRTSCKNNNVLPLSSTGIIMLILLPLVIDMFRLKLICLQPPNPALHRPACKRHKLAAEGAEQLPTGAGSRPKVILVAVGIMKVGLRQWKLQRERLQADFTKALDNFQRAQRSAAQKEKDAIKKYKNQGVSHKLCCSSHQCYQRCLLGKAVEQTWLILREDKTRLRFLYQRWVFRERPITNLSNQLMLEEEQNLEYLQERERSIAQVNFLVACVLNNVPAGSRHWRRQPDLQGPCCYGPRPGYIKDIENFMKTTHKIFAKNRERW